MTGKAKSQNDLEMHADIMHIAASAMHEVKI
jgi:hypothetical protein